MAERVALLGTGIMGTPMARSLLKAGFGVRVWNRTPDKARVLAAEGPTSPSGQLTRDFRRPLRSRQLGVDGLLHGARCMLHNLAGHEVHPCGVARGDSAGACSVTSSPEIRDLRLPEPCGYDDHVGSRKTVGSAEQCVSSNTRRPSRSMYPSASGYWVSGFARAAECPRAPEGSRAAPPVRTAASRTDFEHQVERRLGRPPELRETGGLHHFPNPRLAGLRPEQYVLVRSAAAAPRRIPAAFGRRQGLG